MNENIILPQYQATNLCYNCKAEQHSALLFDNLPEIIRPNIAAKLLGVSVKTIYDWRYRQKTRNIPDDLFLKINRFLYVRTSALKKWINTQNKFL